jgi:hypothetical protein
MDVIGTLAHVELQQKEAICIVLNGLESMAVIGIHLHALVQLKMAI